MPESPSLKFLRSLPPARDIDASEIKGNVSLEHKQLCVNAFEWFVTAEGTNKLDISGINIAAPNTTPYSADVGRRLRVVEIDVLEAEAGRASGRMVAEIKVTADMCNIYGTLHGGCAAYLLDSFMGSPLGALSLVLGKDFVGPTQAMNLKWHRPAPIGTTLQIIGTTLAIQGKHLTVQCDMWDKENKKLLVSSVQTRVNFGLAKPRDERSKSKL